MTPMPRLTRPLMVLLVALQPAAVCSGPAGESITRIASLETARSVHTTTVLPSGKLLVAGGMGPGGGSYASAELVDGVTGIVRSAAPMAQARASHTATALANGRVVIAGGYDGAYLRSVEVFDSARDRFDNLGQMRETRSGHTATLLPDGRILIIGGVGDGWTFLASAELFDPATGRSEPVGSLASPRESHATTLLADGRVLVVGGHQGRREAMEVYASAEVYDPVTRRFTAAGDMQTARHKHDAVRLGDGRVLVIGGADRTDRGHYATTEVFDPATGRFEPGPSMASTRYKLNGTSVLLASGDVLVGGGARTAELLDHKTFTFRSVGGVFDRAYHFATATPLSNGDVVIIGGYGNASQITGGVWRYKAN